jgi:hypothetical protein
MKDLFKDIIDIEDVQGIIFLAFDGKPVFRKFVSHWPQEFEDKNWPAFVTAFNGVQEAELVFENTRLYIRRTGSGYILIAMGRFALTAMVRLNCDLLLSSLDQTKKKPKGIGRFFKKK